MELRQYLDILRRRGWLIIVVLAVAVAVVVGAGRFMPPAYVAQAKVRIIQDVGLEEFLRREEDISRLLTTYVELLMSEPVLEEAMNRLGLQYYPISVSELQDNVDAQVVPNTELIAISVQADDPALARDLADTLAALLIESAQAGTVGLSKAVPEIVQEQLAGLETELQEDNRQLAALEAENPASAEVVALGRRIRMKEDTYREFVERAQLVQLFESVQANKMQLVAPAVLPQEPSNKPGLREIGQSLAIGLFGGISLVLILESLDSRIYSLQQLEPLTDLPLLATVPKGSLPPSLDNSRKGGKSKPIEEAYRLLSISLQALQDEVPARSVSITSAAPRETKVPVATNLALSLAQSGREVVLVDTDMQRPSLHETFNLSNRLGLSTVLEKRTTLDAAVQDSQVPGVWVLTSGPLPRTPAQLLNSPEAVSVTDQVAQQFEQVLLHTAPVLVRTDAAILARAVDGLILVVEQTTTRESDVKKALQQLRAVRAPLLGVVFVLRRMRV